MLSKPKCIIFLLVLTKNNQENQITSVNTS